MDSSIRRRRWTVLCPVEVHRDALGQVVAARMCFTNDVDVLEGNWREIGGLQLSNGRCVACDPDCEGPSYRKTFDVKPGRYSDSVFDFSNPDGSRDVLGLRITWVQDTRVPGQPTVKTTGDDKRGETPLSN